MSAQEFPTVGSAKRLSGRLVRPLAEEIAAWVVAGKLDEDDLDRALSPDARAVVDHSIAVSDWAPLEDVERLVSVAASQLGGETGLVEWAESVADALLAEEEIAAIVASGERLADGAGYAASLASDLLVSDPDWAFEGRPQGFSVTLRGLAQASPGAKALLGACLGRIASAAANVELDVRFEGIDAADLVVFGERASDPASSADESRLHRAALVP